jgi:UDP-N-acetylmuramoyl-tripeptide--D-alanyl-D-alanine ligase
MRISVADAVSVLGATLVGDGTGAFDGVSYDSRTLVAGNLFVAVVAARDGHDFVVDAERSGCAAVLVSREIEACSVPQIVVADTSIALTELGRWARRRLGPTVDGRVVGITGSVGKTTTKDFVAAVLRTEFVVGASEKSLNNDMGLPVTLLNAPDDAAALVLEMGMRGFGEIARLADLARPGIGIVTRVGESHSERVGGVEGVARAKGELVAAIGEGGIALLNADDPRVVGMRHLAGGTCLTFGSAEGADMRISDVVSDGARGVAFSYSSRWGSGRCVLGVPGTHMASNASAALLVAAVCGVDLDAAAAALEHAVISPMRMAIHQLEGLTIVDDSYNASPTSTKAALDTLATMPASRRVAVLGAMAEIDDSNRRHLDVAAHARSLGIEVVAFGTDLYGTQVIDSYDDAVAFVRSLPAESAVLIKGSRVVGLDHVVRLILG